MNAPAVLSVGVKGSCFHLSKVSSLSQGLSLLCVEGMMKRREVGEVKGMLFTPLLVQVVLLLWLSRRPCLGQ